MQWLIDLVIAAIGIPPTFIDRGDPASEDWTLADLIANNLWHDLDLSAIVPEGAQAICMRIQSVNSLTATRLLLRKKGNTNTWNMGFQRTLVAGTVQVADWLVAVDSDRKIEYLLTPIGWTAVSLTVAGWWL